MIPKYVQTEADSWVMVSELPDKTLCLEGIRSSAIKGEYIAHRIRFSREAIEKLVPLMQEWLDA